MNVSDALHARLSSNHFDPNATLSEEEIKALVDLAVEAPSCYNIQHWRFVAVTDPELKGKLCAASYNQPKVREAAVTFVLLGDMKAHEDFVARLRAMAAAGHMDSAVAENLAGQVSWVFSDPARAREEAVRSVGLVGMALMLAAQEKGYSSGPMIGFQPQQVSELLGLDARYFPAMMVAVGPAAPGNGPRKPRLGSDVVLRINSGAF